MSALVPRSNRKRALMSLLLVALPVLIVVYLFASTIVVIPWVVSYGPNVDAEFHDLRPTGLSSNTSSLDAAIQIADVAAADSELRVYDTAIDGGIRREDLPIVSPGLRLHALIDVAEVRLNRQGLRFSRQTARSDEYFLLFFLSTDARYEAVCAIWRDPGREEWLYSPNAVLTDISWLSAIRVLGTGDPDDGSIGRFTAIRAGHVLWLVPGVEQPSSAVVVSTGVPGERALTLGGEELRVGEEYPASYVYRAYWRPSPRY